MNIDHEGDYVPSRPAQKPTVGYWIIAFILLLWGVGYVVLIAEAFFIMRPQDFDRLVNAGMILPGYDDYVQHLPQWIVLLTLFKGFTRLAGAVALLLRRRWAVTLYSMSLLTSCLIFFRGFVLDSRATFEGPAQIGLDVVFFFLSVYAAYFAIAAHWRGILR